jgi:hypothetical protein
MVISPTAHPTPTISWSRMDGFRVSLSLVII